MSQTIESSTETYAAVDLGSNSFHMIVAEVGDGRVQIVDRMREMVRLAGGFDDDDRLTDEAIEVAVQCLERFGQRLRQVPARRLRAVGTNTLRRASNSLSFLRHANAALDHRIEIISGLEEARLVYLGVAHTIFDEDNRRLVVDIGGGSTELIIGKGFDVHISESLEMGCVGMSARFFSDGKVTEKRMRQAVLTARRELRSISALYRHLGWDIALGTSGTITSIHAILGSEGWNDTDASDQITASGLSRLQDDLIARGNVDQIKYQGLAARRAPVLAGGVAILLAVFEALKVTAMDVSSGALREGLLHDLIGRLQKNDIREQTVNDLVERYTVDKEQATRVETMAMEIFQQLVTDWQLSAADDAILLCWAARLHELGLTVAHGQYHKHGAYLLEYSDLPGFSRHDQLSLGLLVQCHRRKFSDTLFADLSAAERDRLMKLAIILRLAVVLNRGRADAVLPTIKFFGKPDAVDVRFPRTWLEDNPLTEADLQAESAYLKAVSVSLSIA